MSELTTNLNNILDIKGNIKSALENKGVDMTGVSFGSYPDKIGEITTSFVTVPLNVSSNGTYTPSEGVDGYSQVNVNVPATQFITETLSVSANGTYTPSEGVNGYSQVNVNVPATQFITETLSVSANGTYTPGEGIDGYSQVVVDVPASGWDQKDLTEGTIDIINLNNSASFVASNALNGNINIQTVILPYATSVGNNAFYNCTSLKQVDLPMCSYIGNSVFYGCTSLSQLSLPVCNSIGMYAIYFCNRLSQLSLPVCSSISAYAFGFCTILSIITIGYSSVCSLGGSNAFNYTKIASGTGSIYVPASLVDAYKSAPNWSYFSTQIFPIE